MMVSTDPAERLASPRRSVSESELCRDMDGGEVINAASHALLTDRNGSYRRRSNDYTTSLTLPRFVSLRKKQKFKYVNIDNQLPKDHHNHHPTVGKKKSFVSKFMGRMRRHMSLFTIPNTASLNVNSTKNKSSSQKSQSVNDQTDHGRGSRTTSRRRNRKHRSTARKGLSNSAHDIRQVAASMAHPLTSSTSANLPASNTPKPSLKGEITSGDDDNVDDEDENLEAAENVCCQNGITPGLAGIRNHGNTCFMNAVVQCLSHTDILAEYFVTDHYKADLHRRYKLHSQRNGGTRGELTEQLALLLKSLWLCQYTPEVSTNFISIVSKYGSQYRGSNQHDAQEFLLWLLDKVHEDLNTATKKRYKKPKNSHGRPDEVVAAETLANHMRCNNSFVQDIFQAQFRSSLKCPTCRRQSNTFDPFRCISIPIPQKQTCAVFITVVFMSSSPIHPPKQVKLGVNVNIHATIKELREALSSRTGIPNSQFVLTKLNANGYYHDFNDNQHISDIKGEHSVYAIETSAPNTKQETELLTLIWFNCKGPEGLRFGYIYAHAVSREAKFEEIQAALLEKMASEMKEGAVNQKLPLKIRVLDGASRKCFLATDVDHPLYMPVVDKALNLFELDGTGPKHLKLIIEWSNDVASKVIRTSEGHLDVDDSVKELEHKEEQPPAVSLDDCFQLYTQEEKLGPENAWMCPNCHKLQQGVKKLSLWSIPDVLVIHLKRFRQSSSQHTKLDTLVDFPMTGLDMAPNAVYRNYNNNYHHHNNNHQNQLTYWSPWKRHRNYLQKPGDSIYDLHAVCNHHGNIQGGHYTAVCKNPTNGKWYTFDDTKLAPVDDWKNIVTSSAYLLFYHRRNLLSLSGSIASTSSVSSCSSSSSGSSDHWIFKIPPPKYTPPKVTKSEDNLLDLDSDSGSKKVNSSNLVNRPFSRGTRAYASMAPITAKQTDSSKLNGETEHHSDDELVTTSVPFKHTETTKEPKSSKTIKLNEDREKTSSEKSDIESENNLPPAGAIKNDADAKTNNSESYMIPYSIVESCV